MVADRGGAHEESLVSTPCDTKPRPKSQYARGSFTINYEELDAGFRKRRETNSRPRCPQEPRNGRQVWFTELGPASGGNMGAAIPLLRRRCYRTKGLPPTSPQALCLPSSGGSCVTCHLPITRSTPSALMLLHHLPDLLLL